MECREIACKLASELNIAPLKLDVALWTIGANEICGKRKANHDKCPLKSCCPSSKIKP